MSNYIDIFASLMKIILSEEEIRGLDKDKKIQGLVTRLDKGKWQDIPFIMYVCEGDKPNQNKLGQIRNAENEIYEIYISRSNLDSIKRGFVIEGMSPRIKINRIIIGREGYLL